MSYCRHGSGNPGCVACAVEKEGTKTREWIKKHFEQVEQSIAQRPEWMRPNSKGKDTRPIEARCPECGGSGEQIYIDKDPSDIIDKSCKSCNGTGLERRGED